MQSLFIVSLPRTYSTQVFQQASRGLGLRQPLWVLDGEILNVDRYAHYQGVRFDESAKFTLPEREPQLTAALHDFLDETVQAEGFVYKDVIQPLVMARWDGLSRCRVLVIRRKVADIAFSMLRQGWFYPQNAAQAQTSIPHPVTTLKKVMPFRYQPNLHRMFRKRFEAGVIEGLVRADCALAMMRGVVVEFDELVHSEKTLVKAFDEIYGVEIKPPVYIDAAFVRKRERIERRRETAEYRRIERQVQEVRGRLAQA